MAIKIALNGTRRVVTKDQLFALAAQGAIGADTPIHVDGKHFLAGQIKGITFGQRQETGGQTSVPPTTVPTIMTITLNGVEQAITREQLLDLALRGIIGPNTVIMINGKPFYVGQAKGIVFGPPLPPTSQPPTNGFSWDSSGATLGDLSSWESSTGSLDGFNQESPARTSGEVSKSSSWTAPQILMKQVKFFLVGIFLLVIGI